MNDKAKKDIKIYCKYDELIDPNDLIDHPKNRNQHNEDQINHLARLYKHHGIRHPIIISNRSKFITAGHGRKLAAIVAKIEKFPVVYQDFESEEKEYAFLQSDNAIGIRSDLNIAGIREDIAIFGDLLDLDSLGLEDLNLNIESIDFPALESSDPDFQSRTFILSNEQNDILDEALKKAEKEEDCSDEINQNKNGNALAAILKRYVYG